MSVPQLLASLLLAVTAAAFFSCPLRVNAQTYIVIPSNGPLTGGNSVVITNSQNIGSGTDIIDVAVGDLSALVTAQGSNWVTIVMPAFVSPGIKDIIIQSSLGVTVLSAAYTVNQVSITIPNGNEVGVDAWLIGVPYTVEWISAVTVSDKITLEFSLNSGTSWTNLATNVPNVPGTNSFSFLTTPSTVSDHCRVRIADMNNTSISDISDNDFSLVERFRILAPNGGEKWYTGQTNTVRWASAMNLGLLTIDYAADGTNFNYNVVNGFANQAGSPSNKFMWVTPKGVSGLFSETAKMRINTLGGQGRDYSDNTFKLAGIEITNPEAGTTVNRGEPLNICWISFGAGSLVALDFSVDDGGSWTNVVPSISNTLGSNTYSWVVDVAPTRFARLRLRSLSDTNVVGVSDTFFTATSGAIIDLTPPSGVYSGGYPVIITGTNFSDGTDVTNVTLCGTSVLKIDSQSATQVVVTSGAARVGLGIVAVYSTSFGVTIKSNAFLYNPAITVVATGRGTVVPDGVVEISYGGSTSFVVTADAYCRIQLKWIPVRPQPPPSSVIPLRA